jgi:hypothetical protein
VYIAEPSACNVSTGRSGQAIAAPADSGMPMPIEPPDEPEVDPEAELADGDAGGSDEAAGSPAGESA